MHSGSKAVCLVATHMTCRISNHLKLSACFFHKTHIRSRRAVLLQFLLYFLLFPFESDSICPIQLCYSSVCSLCASLARLALTRLDSSQLGSTPLPVRSLPGQTLSTRDLAIVNPALRLHSARKSDATTQHSTIISLRCCARPPPELLQPFACSTLY